MHVDNATQVTLVLRGLLGQDVTLEGLTALDGTTGTNAKTLLRAALGLHFGHVNAPIEFVLARRCATCTHFAGLRGTCLSVRPGRTDVLQASLQILCCRTKTTYANQALGKASSKRS